MELTVIGFCCLAPKSSFSSQHDLFTLITVGRLIDGKGLDFLIESMKLLKQVEGIFGYTLLAKGPRDRSWKR